jgi:hypothetical protein
MQDINNESAALLEAATNFFEAFVDDMAEIKASLASIENLLADIKTDTTK